MATVSTTDVFVTGIGAVSCLGGTAGEFWAGLNAGAPLPVPVPGLTEYVPDALAYRVSDGPAEDAGGAGHAGDAGDARGRATGFALRAAREALADAGLSPAVTADMAVVIGTAGGDGGVREGRVPGGGSWRTPFSVAAAVGGALGSFGTNISVSNACAASGYALSVAVDLIRRDEADTVLVGGAEGLAWVPPAAFDRLGATDPERCRPFDARRRGTVFGEGAAMLVVQSARAAAGRPVYGQVRGTAWSCDAHHPTALDPEGSQLVRVARDALAAAGRAPDGIGCVIPHGTGTPPNDEVEYRVLREVFGERVADTPLFSLKTFIGHTAGASAAFAAVGAALMARHGRVPANAPLQYPDPSCPVWLPPTPLRLAPHRSDVLINAYAFGGSNFAMVFGGVR
ncbi:beta-ketoacyl synthase [Streptomyces sp. NRRL S-87]|uniref:beta-ketoacyl-[acyl-carrier-protein] synthase family protein n=1 Tax=Streptomyces sp. NRRL S-87 TaxID=1463920 RepID=UPI0004C2570A|nr:beta-ketoacyl synthase N-terminal-like domain-containing protein [Streptomyces sp. NRRL S-87]